MKPTVPVLLVFFLCLFAAIDVRASVLTVTKTADTSDGICDADCSLREAVTAAASGDTVVFSTLFDTPQTITLTLGQIAINRNLTITGTGQNLVTISGNNASRIFDISGGAVNISGMTFCDGNAPADNGGAIRVVAGTLTASNATFTNNTADGLGGAVSGFNNTTLTLSNLVVIGNFSLAAAISGYFVNIRDSMVKQNTGGGLDSGRDMNIERCDISDNPGGTGVGASRHLTVVNSTIKNHTRGGVAGGDSASTKIVDRCLISGNSRSPGGGGVLSSGLTTIRNTQITNNSTNERGAGILNSGGGGFLYLINSSVIGNAISNGASGGDGGGAGIRNSGGTLYVVSSTISGNVATIPTHVGGGIYSSCQLGPCSALYPINSTISNNTSSSAGAGLLVGANGQAATFSNTLVAENNSTNTSEEDVSGVIMSNGINLIGNTFGSSGWIAGDLLNVNPMLGALADNGGPTLTYSLLPGSPAINAGNNSVAIDPQTQLPLTTDQRGFLRFYGGTVDIGAYELQPEITGTITYGNAAGSPTPRFVSGVLLSAVGSPNLSATSRSDGTYTLGGFGSGAYTVTPSKTGGANGISSFDSGLIAKHVAGLQLLTGNQLIVGDVSGNGTLSSFDSGQIARYTVGISGFGSSANWIFVPVNRTYSSVNSTISGEDFIALLMGDVSGNWVSQ